MPTLTVDNFKIGIDTRKGEDVSDANRLRNAINAIVTNGGAIERRGGLARVNQQPEDSIGLFSTKGSLISYSLTASRFLSGTANNTQYSLTTRFLVADDISTPAYAFATAYTADDYVSFSETPTRRYRCTVAGTSQASIATWAATTAYVVGDKVRPVTTTDYQNIVFVCKTAGTSGGSEPSWDIAVVGGTTPSETTDGTAVWEAQYIFNTAIGATTDDNGMTWTAEWPTPGVGFGAVAGHWFSTVINDSIATILEDDNGRSRLFYLQDDQYYETQVDQIASVTPTDLGSGEIDAKGVLGTITDTAFGDLSFVQIMQRNGAPYDCVVVGFSRFIPDDDVSQMPFDITVGSTRINAENWEKMVNRFSDCDPVVATGGPRSYWIYRGTVSELADATPINITFHKKSLRPNEVTDHECPLNASFRTVPEVPPSRPAFIKLAERMFLGEGELVKFCELSNPADWSDNQSSVGAGFLAAGRQASGDDEVLALGQYQGKLVVHFEDNSQSWIIDTDSDLNAFDQSIPGVGSRYPKSVDNLSGDTFFLSRNGYRSISLLSLTNNLADVDVGTAVEDLVRTVVDALDLDVTEPTSLFNAKLGQFQSFLGDKGFVYTFSRTAKISAWSQYDLPVTVEDATAHDGQVFIRDTNRGIYNFSDTKYDDDVYDASGNITTEAIDFTTEMVFLDAKKPALLKHFHSFDIICTGTLDVSFKYKYHNDDGVLVEAETDAITVNAYTAPGSLLPIDVCAVSIAPVFRSNADTEALRIDAINIHFETLGPMK